MHPFLPYLAPILPGRLFAGRYRLESIVGVDCVLLTVRDTQADESFEIRLAPAARAEGYLASAGRIHLSLTRPARAKTSADRLVRVLARLVAANTATVPDEALHALFDPPVPFEISRVSGSRRIDLLVGDSCPSHCVFCTDKAPPEYNAKLSFEELAASLARARTEGKESATFTGLEPTLREDFVRLIAEAQRLGFTDIQAITNGVRTADKDFLTQLFDHGLTVLIVSVHAPSAETEAGLTGLSWLFERKMKTLTHARDLLGDRRRQERTGRFFRTNSVITRANLELLPDLVRLLDGFESYLVALNYPWIHGLAELNFSAVVPDYPAVLRAIQPFRERLKDAQDPLVVTNLPPCVAEDFDSPSLLSKQVALPRLSLPDAMFRNETGPVIHDSFQMDPSLTYPPLCDGCTAKERCRGVSSVYLRHYGELGLKPLKG